MYPIISHIREQFKHPGTLALSGAGIALILVALFIGISDNPAGAGLVYLGLAFLCFSMIHQWRSTREFGTLLATAVISFPVMLLLHNIFNTVNDKIGVIPVVNQLLDGLAVIFFMAGVFLAPAAALVGILGGVYYLIFK